MKNILVAFDGGRPAHRALEAGIELAQRFDASLAVVSVVPVHPGRAPFDPWDDKSVHDEQLAEARDILTRHGVAAQLFEPTGDPAHMIERVAETGHFDTIVVGSRGLGAAERFLRGSVSGRLATHAKATVVVAR
jgi:nucleotide-binding universal stress UspA family protein